MEQRLRAAVESAPSGLLMTDAAGRIVLVNREIERLFGYSREELLGLQVDTLVPDRFRGPHPGFRAGFTHAPSVRSMGAGRDLYGLRKDGSEVPLEIGLTPVKTDEGLFVLASIVDITARKRAEARFRVAVEASPNGMIMIDAEGRIILVNRAVETQFGYSRAELLGGSIEQLVPQRLRQRHPDHRAEFFAAPRERSMGEGRSLFGLRQDGTEFPVEIGLNPVDTEDGMFVLASIVDVSAREEAERGRRQLEEQLRQAQKMEAIGTLAGGIAHDFRNILNGIIGSAELAQRESGTERQEHLAELLHFAERGTDLIARILTFSRREEYRRQPMPLAPALEEAAKFLRALLPASVEITVDLHEAPPVLADVTSVHQILTNLGTNAAQAMPQGGRLIVSLEPFYVRDSFARANPSLKEGEYAVLTVRDTGVGMDPEVRARVFEPFFTTKEQGSGTGLGLAMVHGIMRDHDGAVLLDTAPGKGATFRCFFPVVAATPAAIRARAAASPKGGGQRVLFVDDEPSLARIGQQRLIALGYEPTVTTSARQALSLMMADPAGFDLVITDYTMPGMDGIDLAKEVTRIRPGLPILLTTGFIDEFPPTLMSEAGIVRVLMKPTRMEEFGRVIAEVLGQPARV
jgi:hypothetical protein